MANDRKIFVCPKNDLESVAIVNYLEKNHQKVLVTGQSWGANWEKLEPEILDDIRGNCNMVKCTIHQKSPHHPSISTTIISMNEYEELVSGEGRGISRRIEGEVIRMPPDFSSVYAVELGGMSPLPPENNIDHHNENAGRPASIEQVAEIVGVPLNLEEKFIAANDSGYIPAMEHLGKSYLMTSEEIQEMVGHIRLLDRQCQGITQEQENEAQKVVDSLNISEKKDLIIIEDFSHSRCATLTDRLYGQYENLLICSQDGEINFYGDSRIVQNLAEEFGGWNGQGFWGSNEIDKATVIANVMEQTMQLVDDENLELAHVKCEELAASANEDKSIEDMSIEDMSREDLSIEIDPFEL